MRTARTPPRRSRQEMAIGRFLHIEQRWRRRSDRTVWRVYQVYRSDCQVMFVRPGAGARELVPFTALRGEWIYIADKENP